MIEHAQDGTSDEAQDSQDLTGPTKSIRRFTRHIMYLMIPLIGYDRASSIPKVIH